jgi:hypothetical protein
VYAEAVRAAKVCAEALFGDAVAVVSAAFMPGTVLALPVLCALALPNVAMLEAFGLAAAGFAEVSGSRLPVLHWTFGAALNGFAWSTALIVPLLDLAGFVPAVLGGRRT